MLSRKTWTRGAWSKLAASSDESAGTDPSRWQFPAVLGVKGLHTKAFFFFSYSSTSLKVQNEFKNLPFKSTTLLCPSYTKMFLTNHNDLLKDDDVLFVINGDDFRLNDDLLLIHNSVTHLTNWALYLSAITRVHLTWLSLITL